MSRAALTYGAPAYPVREFAGFNPDVPVEGFYRMRLRSGGVFVGVRIWHGLPLDPDTGEELDRAPRWNAQINGTWSDIEAVWPRCAGEAVTADEYAHLCRMQAWGREHAPDSPFAEPTRRADPLQSPILF